ncbi:DUF724 domain-containing protein 5 [Heracleum sosnowskyi]|uniref:DUF724 domain-containing protein 5 n=1 Tax=Heracleum sosnowskyi TaxID=360622 RepID=A0AAD8LXH4_9APIA|nr:DUF724 domain-containing protein 5 [Heracleum sosnowskyi]
MAQHRCTNANARRDDFGTPPSVTDNSFEPSAPRKNIANESSNDSNGELRPPFGPTVAFIFFATLSSNGAKSDQSLPFVKCSPVWKFIKSMEIFKKMPQKPHFSPLFECKEETREGLAIGHMVRFSNVLGTSKPKFSDSSIVIERKLETLDALEPYGFDVGAIRSILTELLLKKEKT